MRSRSLTIGLLVLAAAFLLLAAGYAAGAVQFLTSRSSGHHYTHAILFVVLAGAALVGANFARPRA